jgi:hypothetical protein
VVHAGQVARRSGAVLQIPRERADFAVGHTIDADAAYLQSTYLAPDLPAGRYVCLDVTDDGEGMTSEVQSRLFEPYFSTRATGRGLGLPATLGVLRGHRGAGGSRVALMRRQTSRRLADPVNLIHVGLRQTVTDRRAAGCGGMLRWRNSMSRSGKKFKLSGVMS